MNAREKLEIFSEKIESRKLMKAKIPKTKGKWTRFRIDKIAQRRYHIMNAKDKQIRMKPDGFKIITDIHIPDALGKLLKQARDENRPIKKILITPDLQRFMFGGRIVNMKEFTLFGIPVEVVDGDCVSLLVKTYQWNGGKVE